MKEVFVLWHLNGEYFYQQRTCFGTPDDTDPEKYGLRPEAEVILVQSNFRGANTYLNGNLVTEAF